MTDTTESEIVYCPPGKPGGLPTEINLGFWARQEARLQEVASVTPQKAPELMGAFNRCALDLDRLANTIELEYQFAEREVEKIKAEVILDRVPKVLAEKGLVTAKNPMGSEDLREAVLAQDAQYQETCDTRDMLKAMTKMLRGKYNAFERAFRAVKTMVGEQNFNFTLPARELSAGRDSNSNAPVGINSKPKVAGFGAPKFGNGVRPSAQPVAGDDIPY